MPHGFLNTAALLRLVLAVTAIFILACALAPLASRMPFASYWDKLDHAAAFAALAFLSALAFPVLRARVIAPILLAFGVAIEILQLIPSLNRSAEFGDLFADVAGIAIGFACINLFRIAAGWMRPGFVLPAARW
ncbi:MAG: VanZ family protein [Beijerinckiaceae bacterium]